MIYNHLPQEDFTVSKEAAQPDAVIVRSASMLEMELPGSLLSIARAGAGITELAYPELRSRMLALMAKAGVLREENARYSGTGRGSRRCTYSRT